MTSRTSPSMPARATLALVLPLIAALAACGGGGNESGPADSIQLSTSTITVQGTTTACFSGVGPSIYVYGGQPPYTVTNSGPTGMSINTAHVQDSGQGFSITFTGQCMQSIPLTVQDDMGRLATVSVTNSTGAIGG